MANNEGFTASSPDNEPRIERQDLPAGGYIETGLQIDSETGTRTTTFDHRNAAGNKIFEEYGAINPTSGESHKVTCDFYPGAGDRPRRQETTTRRRYLESSESNCYDSEGRLVSTVDSGLSLITGRLRVITKVFDRKEFPLIDEKRIIQAAPPGA